jgi:hypothetical protein
MFSGSFWFQFLYFPQLHFVLCKHLLCKTLFYEYLETFLNIFACYTSLYIEVTGKQCYMQV